MFPLMGLVLKYGLFGLFIYSFIVSTIFVPATVDVVLPIMISVGLNQYEILIVATIGSLLGTWINYYIGYIGSKIIDKHLKEENVIRIKKRVDKYGWLGLLVIIAIPVFPVDPITVLCGVARMNFLEFTIVVFLGKLLKYSFVIGIFEFIIKIIA